MTFLSPIRKGKHVIKVFAHRIGLTFCLLFCQEKSQERVCIKAKEQNDTSGRKSPYIRPQLAQPLINKLITPVYLLNILNYTFSFGA